MLVYVVSKTGRQEKAGYIIATHIIDDTIFEV